MAGLPNGALLGMDIVDLQLRSMAEVVQFLLSPSDVLMASPTVPNIQDESVLLLAAVVGPTFCSASGPQSSFDPVLAPMFAGVLASCLALRPPLACVPTKQPYPVSGPHAPCGTSVPGPCSVDTKDVPC